MNCLTTYTNNLFIGVKSNVELTKDPIVADNRRMVRQQGTDSPEQYSSCFEFSISPTLATQSIQRNIVYPNIFMYIYIYIYICVCVCVCVCVIYIRVDYE